MDSNLVLVIRLNFQQNAATRQMVPLPNGQPAAICLFNVAFSNLLNILPLLIRCSRVGALDACLISTSKLKLRVDRRRAFSIVSCGQSHEAAHVAITNELLPHGSELPK